MKKNYFVKGIALCALLLVFCLLLPSCAKSASDSATNGMAMAKPMEEGGAGAATLTVDTSRESDRKIIKTFDLSCETKNYDDAMAMLERTVAAHNGYVESASTSNQSLNSSLDTYTRTATLTIRIPADQASAFVGAIGDVLHVTQNNSSVEDVSETYYSIEARLEELKVERESLLNIMESINTQKDYDFWLTVNQRLSEVTQQIAVYQGQINRLDGQIEYSTVQIRLREVLSYSAVNQERSFGKRLGAAFASGWSTFVTICQTGAIWLAAALPTLLLAALIITGVILIIRRVRRR